MLNTKSPSDQRAQTPSSTTILQIASAGRKVWDHTLLRNLILDHIQRRSLWCSGHEAAKAALREFKHVMLVNNATFHDSISRVYRSVGRFPAPRSSQFERDSLSLDLTEFMGELNARTERIALYASKVSHLHGANSKNLNRLKGITAGLLTTLYPNMQTYTIKGYATAKDKLPTFEIILYRMSGTSRFSSMDVRLLRTTAGMGTFASDFFRIGDVGKLPVNKFESSSGTVASDCIACLLPSNLNLFVLDTSTITILDVGHVAMTPSDITKVTKSQPNLIKLMFKIDGHWEVDRLERVAAAVTNLEELCINVKIRSGEENDACWFITLEESLQTLANNCPRLVKINVPVEVAFTSRQDDHQDHWSAQLAPDIIGRYPQFRYARFSLFELHDYEGTALEVNTWMFELLSRDCSVDLYAPVEIDPTMKESVDKFCQEFSQGRELLLDLIRYLPDSMASTTTTSETPTLKPGFRQIEGQD